MSKKKRPPALIDCQMALGRIPGPLLYNARVQWMVAMSARRPAQVLMHWTRAGLTLTQTWNTANTLETKVEMADNLAKGLKAEGIFSFLPASQARGAKFNLHFKQSNFHTRLFFDLLKGPTANFDAIVGHEGFLAGASAGFDVQKAKVTGYSAAVGYQAPTYTAAITATDNLSVFAASYYHKVNSQVEAGSKATWNSKSGNAVGLEVAAKYRLDPVSFVKVGLSNTWRRVELDADKRGNRPRSTTAVSLLLPTTCSSARVSPSALALLLIPRSLTRPPTRLAPASLSSRKLLAPGWQAVGVCDGVGLGI
jgi:voltage-dependent anion channel protein 2